jgi:hypothetical protein
MLSRNVVTALLIVANVLLAHYIAWLVFTGPPKQAPYQVDVSAAETVVVKAANLPVYQAKPPSRAPSRAPLCITYSFDDDGRIRVTHL